MLSRLDCQQGRLFLDPSPGNFKVDSDEAGESYLGNAASLTHHPPLPLIKLSS